MLNGQKKKKKKKKTIETTAYVMMFHASFALLFLAISNIKIIIINDKKKII